MTRVDIDDVLLLLGNRDGHPSICVKERVLWAHDRRTAALIDRLGEYRTSVIYDALVEEFWMLADEVAKNHGYDGVYSEGRSDGWLCVTGLERGLSKMPANDQFLKFAIDIVQLQRDGELRFIKELKVASYSTRHDSKPMMILDASPGNSYTKNMMQRVKLADAAKKAKSIFENFRWSA